MSVIQVNVWTCDFCGVVQSDAQITGAWDDPVVRYPSGWESKTIPEEKRKHPCLNCGDACPKCLQAVGSTVVLPERGVMFEISSEVSKCFPGGDK